MWVFKQSLSSVNCPDNCLERVHNGCDTLNVICHPRLSLYVAPTAPLNLTFLPGGVLNDSITLTWLSPEHPSGVVWFYQLQHSSYIELEVMHVNTAHNSTTIVLSDLVPGTRYNFSVRAFTVAFGPFSAQLSVHTADGEGVCAIILVT